MPSNERKNTDWDKLNASSKILLLNSNVSVITIIVIKNTNIVVTWQIPSKYLETTTICCLTETCLE